jgi:hypothetical protein
MVRRLNASDTYSIEDIQIIGVDVGNPGITGISVAITIVSDRLNIIISHTTPDATSLTTSASLTTLITSLG